MNCLQCLTRSSVVPLYSFRAPQRKVSFVAVKNMRTRRTTVANLRVMRMRSTDPHYYGIMALKAVPDSTSGIGPGGSEVEPKNSNKTTGSEDKSNKTSSSEVEPEKSNKTSGSEAETEKSDEYSQNMTQAMGAVLTYRHELGMNYDFILPDLIVGSCLQTPDDLDKLRSVGVKTVFCLQQNPDLEYFGVDIVSIQEHAKTYDDIQHLRAEIRDFDSFDLRLRLPAVISQLYKAVTKNGGITYIHCTAGLGRAPAVALAYMFWVQGYKLSDAYNLLLSKRSCFPKVDAIKSATADLLTGLKRKLVTLTWKGDTCTTVEVSGLDIGWTQRMPLIFDAKQGMWILRKELPEGHYEYKYIVDGEWTCNENELVGSPNKDGHVNNYVKVEDDDENSANAGVRERLTSDDPDLTKEEREKIIKLMQSFSPNDK